MAEVFGGCLMFDVFVKKSRAVVNLRVYFQVRELMLCRSSSVPCRAATLLSSESRWFWYAGIGELLFLAARKYYDGLKLSLLSRGSNRYSQFIHFNNILLVFKQHPQVRDSETPAKLVIAHVLTTFSGASCPIGCGQRDGSRFIFQRPAR